MRYREAVQRLERGLPSPLPAPPDVLMPVRLDTVERRTPAVPFGPEAARPAAVLVLVAPTADMVADPAAEVVLIERVDRGDPHGGQISLPGGRVERADTSAADAALREAREEVGLDPGAAGVRIIGWLERFWIPVSGYRVTPVVALAARRPELRASPDEVVSIIRAPLAAFLPGARIELVETTVRDVPLRFGAYPVAGHRIWGATARILGQLGAALATP
jgi:8-oxo-dGTP pyrophosphatase MutT (NUDIX family)